MLEDCVRFGMPFPERIANAPDLDLGLGLYYQGFLDLTSCRQMGMGLGPISYMTMADYCTALGLSDDQREDFLWLIPRLDAKYLEWSRGRSNTAPIQSPDQPGSGQHRQKRGPANPPRRSRR